ncbi:MAG: DUF2892 domain-containing protein [Pseudomonadota bacterium]
MPTKQKIDEREQIAHYTRIHHEIPRGRDRNGGKFMSVERTLFAFGGIMVMVTSLLALFHHPYWTWVTLFIGFNCLQSSFTGFCPPSWLMKKFGMKTEAELALESLRQ